MPKTQTDYEQTYIYKICCLDPSINDVYIGHTTNFVQRKNQHKTICNDPSNKSYNRRVYGAIRYNGGWDNWTMLQIEEFSCKNRREAEAREHYWIEQTAATLNSNMPYAMCKENPQLYKKNWYEEKKDYILQKAKDNYEENKEQKLEYQKQYAEKNKEKILDYQKQYAEDNKEKLAEQKKVYRSLHKEEAAKLQKDWREANKEKLKEQKAQLIICECGSEYTLGNKNRHLQTKTHVKYENQLCGIIVDEDKISQEKEALLKERKEKAKEKQKEYREKNAEKIAEQKKIYNEKNKEKNQAQRKKYYEEHKDAIIEYQKEYENQNKEKVKAYKDEWYQKNKEKVLEKQSQLFTCECGAEVRFGSKAEHYASQKHLDNLLANTSHTSSQPPQSQTDPDEQIHHNSLSA